jgi:large subunit ribosomal protein L12e|eukprot:gnl/Ergobibamus_cyprinoides/212.p2 GENE.gnl/Ergobibamus_cyprinoides/212~~gnl/Ergobibamus_cyprinoides/212.p2  ORF type:complete len:176 (+),score=91.90 gnl/Ergobibamus_cyprinoides/212:29-529(+)
MAPGKFDPAAETVIYLRATGGEPQAVASLAPKVGPLGLPPKKISDDIQKNTGDWKGLRITVKLTIKNRVATVSVVPSAGALVIKALNEPARDRKKEKNIAHNGNITLNDIIEIARIMRERSFSATLAGVCKEILGTARAVGCTVEGLHPSEIVSGIDDGTYEIPAN